jgi:hypothetical protein
MEKGYDATSDLSVIEAALALGRIAGLTGKDEVICLEVCTLGSQWPTNSRS